MTQITGYSSRAEPLHIGVPYIEQVRGQIDAFLRRAMKHFVYTDASWLEFCRSSESLTGCRRNHELTWMVAIFRIARKPEWGA